jgi:lauroyl/myristoyl acyltransferase
MDTLLYFVARPLIGLLQKLPLRWVARLGRAGGGLAFWLDARHRRVALKNLALCFAAEKSRPELRRLARENFRRIGENFACAVKTASMSAELLRPHVQFAAPPELIAPRIGDRPDRVVAAIGHFGNFELYARFGEFAAGYKTATTYRGLRQASLNELLQSLRTQSGCLFFERRFETAALKAYMNQPGVLLGLLADQHAGPRGLRLPFLGVECSTSAAPALFALRYDCALYPGICHRLGLAQWRIEGGARIPTHHSDGRARSPKEIMLDVNRAFEAAVRKDPANWFWVHNRWKDHGNSGTELGKRSFTAQQAQSEKTLEPEEVGPEAERSV